MLRGAKDHGRALRRGAAVHRQRARRSKEYGAALPGNIAPAARLTELIVPRAVPLVIDSMSNAGETAYSSWPERLYVLDPAPEGETGRVVAYKGGMGPDDYDPHDLEKFLASRYEPLSEA